METSLVLIASGTLLLIAGTQVVYDAVQAHRDRKYFDLPSPSPYCRFCRIRFITRKKEKNGWWLALQAIPEPETCTITSPHAHVQCDACGATYPVKPW